MRARHDTHLAQVRQRGENRLAGDLTDDDDGGEGAALLGRPARGIVHDHMVEQRVMVEVEIIKGIRQRVSLVVQLAADAVEERQADCAGDAVARGGAERVARSVVDEGNVFPDWDRVDRAVGRGPVVIGEVVEGDGVRG